MYRKTDGLDVEGYARRSLNQGRASQDIISDLADRIVEIKGVSRDYALSFAKAVMVEVNATRDLKTDITSYEKAGVSMGMFGVDHVAQGTLCSPEGRRNN